MAQANAQTDMVKPSSDDIEKCQVAGGASKAVHAVGHLTPEVLSYLKPAIAAIYAAGKAQVVLVTDGEYAEAKLKEIGLRKEDLELHFIPDTANSLHRIQLLHNKLKQVKQETCFESLHLHGVLPAFAGAMMVHGERERAAYSVFLSPHSSRALVGPHILRIVLIAILRLLLRGTRRHPVVNLKGDAKLIASISPEPVHVVPSTAATIFFHTLRTEATKPLVVAGGRSESPEGALRFAQLAVLLGGNEMGLEYSWLSECEETAIAPLKAAGVQPIRTKQTEERADHLSKAWVYVAPAEERGFPIALVEAMAVGVPCVAIDTETHIQILGREAPELLCANHTAITKRIAELIDNPDLRRSLGEKCRNIAISKFSEKAFQQEASTLYERR